MNRDELFSVSLSLILCQCLCLCLWLSLSLSLSLRLTQGAARLKLLKCWGGGERGGRGGGALFQVTLYTEDGARALHRRVLKCHFSYARSNALSKAYRGGGGGGNASDQDYCVDAPVFIWKLNSPRGSWPSSSIVKLSWPTMVVMRGSAYVECIA